MREHYLTPLFYPKSIAVVGASDKSGSIGQQVFANLILQQSAIKLIPVNLRHKLVGGIEASPSLLQVKEAIDLVVVVTKSTTYEDILNSCHKIGARFIILIKTHEETTEGVRVMPKIIRLAKKYGIRILGPSFLGLVRPSSGFNASTYAGEINPGKIAFVSQSSSVCSSLLDWSKNRSIGFSTVLSFGEDHSDIDFGEVLDFLVNDKETIGILLHVHHVNSGRKFMSALRSAARLKPVVVIKSGRAEELGTKGFSISEQIPEDIVFSRALVRAGVLQVKTFSEMYVATRILAANYRVDGNNLAIIGNGWGLGILAKDVAFDLKVQLAPLQTETVEALSKLKGVLDTDNPIDISGNASPLRFRTVAKLCLEDNTTNALLVLFSPQIGTDSYRTAEMMVQLQKQSKKPILVSWLGYQQTAVAELFAKNRILQFSAPEHAVQAFRNLTKFHHSQMLLRQIPHVDKKQRKEPNFKRATDIITETIESENVIINDVKSKEILQAYHLDCHSTYFAKTKKALADLTTQLDYPLVLKILVAEGIDTKKVKTKILGIRNKTDLLASYDLLQENLKKSYPNVQIEGVSVEEEIDQERYRIQVVVVQDRVFGPIIALRSGKNVIVENNQVLCLPPLNDVLIRGLIDRIQIQAYFIDGKQITYRQDALVDLLLVVSEMVAQLPEIKEMKMEVLLANKAIVSSAKILLKTENKHPDRYAHMAIMPYPVSLEKELVLKNGAQVKIRPIRDTDAEMIQDFIRNLSDESRYNRFMSSIKQLSESTLIKFTQLDYDREMGLVMIYQHPDKKEEMLAASRYVTDPDMEACEFAVSVSDNWQGQGVGSIMMKSLFEVARDQGLKTMRGEVLTVNSAMQRMMKKLGFSIRKDPEDNSVCLVEKNLVEDKQRENILERARDTVKEINTVKIKDKIKEKINEKINSKKKT